jgi:hypothetical protein
MRWDKRRQDSMFELRSQVVENMREMESNPQPTAWKYERDCE